MIEKIQSHQKQRQHYKVDEPLLFDIFQCKNDRTATELNGKFIYFQLLIDCLIRMTSTSDERDELIRSCKQQYKGNLYELQDFEQHYPFTEPLRWYTKQSFLHRMLNKALRVQNIDLLYQLRFFIRDLRQSLEKHKCLTDITVYRGQIMSKEEIRILEKSVGEFISINSFFSTSLNKHIARIFLNSDDVSNDHQQVLFEINALSKDNHMKPFSNIQKFSDYPDEEEVLFMAGSIFQLEKVECNNDGICNIKMKFCSDNDIKLQSLFVFMKDQLSTEETNPLIFGHILRDMGKLNDAEKYYHRYREQLSRDNPNLFAYYHALGRIAHTKGNYTLSLKSYKNSLEIIIQVKPSDHPDIAVTYKELFVKYIIKRTRSITLPSLTVSLLFRTLCDLILLFPHESLSVYFLLMVTPIV